jgi:hypothetical protein
LIHALFLLPVLTLSACHPAGPSPTTSRSPNPAPTATAPAQPDALSGWTATGQPRRIISQDLFNHIDGAAEGFLEMGFRELLVRRYNQGDATLTCETYAMKDPTAARGIYLRFRGRGTPVPGVTGRNFGNQYQIAAQKDRFYIQVTNVTGEEQSLSAMVKLTNQATAAIPTDGPVPQMDLLPTAGLVPNSEALVCGPTSLQTVYVFGEGDILQLQNKIWGVAADYQSDRDGKFTRLIIPYNQPALAQAAFKNLQQGLDAQFQVVHRDDQSLTFRDADNQFGTVKVANDRLDIRLHLTRDPISSEI